MKLDNVFKKTRLSSARKAYIALGHNRRKCRKACFANVTNAAEPLLRKDVKNGYYICPKCGGYFRVHAYRRIEMVGDEGTFEEWDQDLASVNPLHYKGYEEKLAGLREKTGPEGGCGDRQGEDPGAGNGDRRLRRTVYDVQYGSCRG